MFKERLKELREYKGLTQSQLSEKLKIGRASVSNYELGARTPDIDVLVKISEYFNVTTDYLTGRSDFKNIEEELQHKNTIEKLGIQNNALSLTNEEKEEIINSVNLLYNSLVEFFSSHASENSILKSNTPHGDIVFNGAIVFDTISNFSRIINIISELYKVSAHTYKYKNLIKNLDNYYELPIDRSKKASGYSQQEILESNKRSVEFAKIQGIIQNSNIALGLKNSIIDCMQTILKSYIPEDMYY
ncbi:helix-turn-helix transcriptional regulator [Clostridium botulinum]|nr:helix-turn-helix transcriptional regulator [Clostridium botulinum]